MNTLTAPHEDVLNRILYFVPTCRLLIHFELTCWQFRSLTKSHMRTMTIVDLLQDEEYYGPVLTNMLNFVGERFSDKLTKLTLYRCQDTLEESLALSHPQLFPGNMPKVRKGGPIQIYIPWDREVDDIYMQLYRGYVFESPWVGRHTEIKCDYKSLNYWFEYLMKAKTRLFLLDDFASVETLDLSLEEDDHALDYLAQLMTLFRGLKQLNLILRRTISSEDASLLKNFIAISNIQVFLKTSSPLIQNFREILGRYVSKYALDLELDHSLSNFVNLKELYLSFDEPIVAPECLLDFPSGVESLTLSKPYSETFDVISRLLKTHGRPLLELEVDALFNSISDDNKMSLKEQMQLLVDAVCLHCVNLKSLNLRFTQSHSFSSLKQRLTPNTNVGHSLCDDMIDAIAANCKTLRSLHLDCDLGDGLDEEGALEKLKRLTKLRTIELSPYCGGGVIFDTSKLRGLMPRRLTHSIGFMFSAEDHMEFEEEWRRMAEFPVETVIVEFSEDYNES